MAVAYRRERVLARREGRYQLPESVCLAPVPFPQSALVALVSAHSGLLFGNMKFWSSCGTLLPFFPWIARMAILLPSVPMVKIWPSAKAISNAVGGRWSLGNRGWWCLSSPWSIKRTSLQSHSAQPSFPLLPHTEFLTWRLGQLEFSGPSGSQTNSLWTDLVLSLVVSGLRFKIAHLLDSCLANWVSVP